MTSFSPLHTIGFQIREALLLHTELRGRECEERAVEMLAKVRIPDPAQRFHEYPHQLSGGMRQRAMIAMALSCNPSLLIADEPTTALDVTVQAQVLELMRDLQRETGMAILYITHNLGVVAEMVDTVAVMYLGRIVEIGPVDDIFYAPLHPYTQALLRSVPKLGARVKERLQSIEGTVPLPLNLGPQCHFHQRCPLVIKGVCAARSPTLDRVTAEHSVRCFLHSGGAA
jgi:peptide/nickel transport system ATP-binding protein